MLSARLINTYHQPSRNQHFKSATSPSRLNLFRHIFIRTRQLNNFQDFIINKLE